MSWFLRTFAILFLSICVLYQGIAVYTLIPGQESTTQQPDSTQDFVVSLTTPLVDSTLCCDAHDPIDQQAEKENGPTLWEIDTHGPASHLAYLPLGTIRVSASENSSYPTPVYTLHRPPDFLS
jgi:hypothetical protein